MPEKMIFIVEGKAVSDFEADRYPILAAGLIADNVVHAFNTQKEFEKWTESTRYLERIRSVETKILEAKQYEETETSAIKQRQIKVVNRIIEDMNELAERLELDPASEELFLKATSKSDVLEGPIFDPAIVFDSIGTFGSIGVSGSSWLPFTTGVWPDLRWFDWNDRISSVTVSGLVVFFEHTWFAGRCLWLGAIPLWYFHDLKIFGFNNRASSAIVVA